MRCNTENGQCYINWYYWLNPNMHGTVNFIIMNYSTASYVVSYQCNSIWWLLWTSVWEEFEIWAPSTVMSDSSTGRRSGASTAASWPHHRSTSPACCGCPAAGAGLRAL